MARGDGIGAREIHEKHNKMIVEAIRQAEKVILALPRVKTIRPKSRSRSRSVASQTESDTESFYDVSEQWNNMTEIPKPRRSSSVTTFTGASRTEKALDQPADNEFLTRDRVVRYEEKTYLIRELLPKKASARLTPRELKRLITNKDKIGISECPCPYKFKPRTDNTATDTTLRSYQDSDATTNSINLGNMKPRRVRSEESLSKVEGNVKLTKTKNNGIEIKIPTVIVPKHLEGNFMVTFDLDIKQPGKSPRRISNVFELNQGEVERIYVDGQEFIRTKNSA
ncbi:unnamed protein product [Bursaphelenchus okinawaensis]|uniref:Uncharacterized protein n=1 Tax=Bursaphelenchus okinawaensis TaxID=465554 RepID=A0A811JQQ9_9BILA|nr:unnamed protein product [Bursaphelenchus okinawaensis]CAG9078202.1 unnamed protein product [Bursaphelenchus okinawaensis]